MKIVVCVDIDWGIGYNNGLLVKIPHDHCRFRELTLRHKVLMGRKTFFSLPNSNPLPGRENLILSKHLTHINGAIVLNQLDSLLNMDTQNLFVIGGASIYEQLLDFCSYAYVTLVYKSFKKDCFFPNLDLAPHWEIVNKSEIFEYAMLNYSFFEYKNNAVNKYA